MVSANTNLGCASPNRYRKPMDLVHIPLRCLGRARYLPFRLRDRILRRFADPDHIMATPFQTNFHGMTYRGDLSSFIDWETYFYGAYEPEVLSLIAELANRAGSDHAAFIDVGANVGQHSLFAASRGLRVVAFEPWDVARGRLEANVGDNGLTNVQVFACALGREDSRQEMYVPAGVNTGTGSLLADYNPDNNTATQPVDVRRGDGVLREVRLPPTSILKLDVEGTERAVLEGLQRFIQCSRPSIIMEVSAETRQSFASAEEFMALLPEDSELFEIRRRFDRHALEIFDFDHCRGNILILPK